QRQEAGVGEQDVEAALLPLHCGEQPVEVREVGDVARHAGDVLADFPDRFIEFRLAASGDVDVGALGDELPGRGQADSAVGPGNDGALTFQFLRPGTPPLPVKAVRVKPCEWSPAQPTTSSRDANSPIMMLGALVLAEGIVGMTEASAMRRPRTRRTRSSTSTTASWPGPIAQVPTGWR